MCACVRVRVHASACLYFFSCPCVCVCVFARAHARLGAYAVGAGREGGEPGLQLVQPALLRRVPARRHSDKDSDKQLGLVTRISDSMMIDSDHSFMST